MTKTLYSLAILLALNFSGYTQQNEPLSCGTDAPTQRWEERLQELIAAERNARQNAPAHSADYTIPVIFHIIHGGEAAGNYPNLRQEQIHAQMTVLNQDFSGNAYNAADYPDDAFVQWAINQALPAANLDEQGRVKIANFNIQFCLATQDPSGNILAEPGIDRIDYNSKGWQNPTAFSTQPTLKNYLDNTLKPQSIWDVTQYLNVWVTDKNAALPAAGVSTVPPLSGIADLPNTATDSTDGIWCFARAVGSFALFPAGNYASPNVDGRTLTHEAGHYFGLRHIWGDAACGNDFCDDTPPAAAQNVGSPIYPFHVGTCASPSNNPDGEMFMNFMDYTIGPKKYMFTVDQMTRAQTAMHNSPFRKQLGTHGLCTASVGAVEPKQQHTAKIFPNPSKEILNIEVPHQILVGVKIHNAMGEFVQEYTTNSISVAHLANGMYYITIETDQIFLVQKFVKI